MQKICKRKYLGGKDPVQLHLQFQVDSSVSAWTYDSTIARESLGRLIATMDLPIRRSYCSQFKKVSRTTIRSDIIAYYNKVHIALLFEIGSYNFCFALIYDIWNGRVHEDYFKCSRTLLRFKNGFCKKE